MTVGKKTKDIHFTFPKERSESRMGATQFWSEPSQPSEKIDNPAFGESSRKLSLETVDEV
jgi:hypothetical protein